MADIVFQAPNAGQVRENREILKQLEEQKRRLRMAQGGGAAIGGTAGPNPMGMAHSAQPTAASGPVAPNMVPPSVLGLAEPQHMAPSQRTALQHAHGNSVGYYTTQDSSFGNLILPVLPRFHTT